MTHVDGVLPWRRRRTRDTAGFVSPAVRRTAAERGVDANTITGTGANGRVTRADVVAPAAAAPRGDQVVPFNTVRKRAAGLLLESKRTSPHALCTTVANYSAIDAARAGTRLTYLPFVARAVCDAIRQFPMMNAAVDGESLVVRRAINLGIAVDLDFQGLVVPVVRGADGLRLHALGAAIRDVAARARTKKLSPDDVAGGTFTVTNPGGYGTWLSFPIINQPQVGILSTDGVSKQVIVDDGGRLDIAPVGHLCLTFDHRAVDGAYAASFLARIREIIETRDWSTES
ncbi:MAG: dihydrolipoamide acetyltransferase family protein [Actinomycetota bacterium]